MHMGTCESEGEGEAEAWEGKSQVQGESHPPSAGPCAEHSVTALCSVQASPL